MCNAYNLGHRNEAILDIARAMQLPFDDLPDFPPRYCIGIKDRGLILRPRKDGFLAWYSALWGLIPFGSHERPLHPFNNARSDKLGIWPWRGVQRKRCLVPASGVWEPEKPAREKGAAPWSYYSMMDGRPFFMAGLWAEASGPATGEVADTYTLIITDANAIMRVHDRMPVILATDAARRWMEPGPLPAELLAPYLASRASSCVRHHSTAGRAGMAAEPPSVRAGVTDHYRAPPGPVTQSTLSSASAPVSPWR